VKGQTAKIAREGGKINDRRTVGQPSLDSRGDGTMDRSRLVREALPIVLDKSFGGEKLRADSKVIEKRVPLLLTERRRNSKVV